MTSYKTINNEKFKLKFPKLTSLIIIKSLHITYIGRERICKKNLIESYDTVYCVGKKIWNLRFIKKMNYLTPQNMIDVNQISLEIFSIFFSSIFI